MRIPVLLLLAAVFYVCCFNETIIRHKRVPRTETHIINPYEVESIEDLLDLEELNTMNLPDYIGSLSDKSPTAARKALGFLARYGIIPNSRRCGPCDYFMSLVRDSSVKNDQHVWRCSVCRKRKVMTKIAIRSGSFFENLHLSVQKLIYMAAEWIESPSTSVQRSAANFEVSVNTVVQVHEWFRLMTKQWFERESRVNSNTKLGGPNKVVEIDETLMHKAKYNRGRMLTRKQVWVFGMIERGSSKIVMFRVAKRNAATLLPIIEKYVLPGTTIVSDGWAAYGGIGALQSGYNHRWVNHKVNFVDPSDYRVHTQSIEASWGVLKRQLKGRFGTLESRLDGHMYNYMWRRFFDKKKLLNRLIFEMKFFRRPTDDSDSDDLDSDSDSHSSHDDNQSDQVDNESVGENEQKNSEPRNSGDSDLDLDFNFPSDRNNKRKWSPLSDTDSEETNRSPRKRLRKTPVAKRQKINMSDSENSSRDEFQSDTSAEPNENQKTSRGGSIHRNVPHRTVAGNNPGTSQMKVRGSRTFRRGKSRETNPGTVRTSERTRLATIRKANTGANLVSSPGTSSGTGGGTNSRTNLGMKRGSNRGKNRGINRGSSRGTLRGTRRGTSSPKTNLGSSRLLNRGSNRGSRSGTRRGTSRATTKT